MPEYRRRRVPGGTYFFTVVTTRRASFLCDPSARVLLRNCLRKTRENHPFTIDAIVLLPDHLHTIWTLPPGDCDYSLRWSSVKGNFTRRWLRADGAERAIRSGRRSERRREVWQPRFMEHTIRDDEDRIAHFDYLHYNPVKHGLVRCPRDWPHSSFHRHVREGVYPPNWCCGDEVRPPAYDRVDDGLLE